MLYGCSIFMICSGVAAAIIIAADIKLRPQRMKIMNTVWVLTGLWGSYLALWAYYRFGRENNRVQPLSGKTDSMAKPRRMTMEPGMTVKMPEEKGSVVDMAGMKMDMPVNSPARLHWQPVALSTLHCGAGCTLADLVGETVTYYYPLEIGGSVIAGSWVFDFILALLIGVYFQYRAIREMEKTTLAAGIRRAFKADFFSLASWQLGMYSWMALVYFVLFRETSLEKGWIFWFMMQVAMLSGFFFAYPVNVLLVRSGIKKGM